ncbi:OmpA family protein [Qipengyuania sp.]|uniref:OmpA family protein n=1 Tax=Qipengyuania sp. TaxID=2004515 RepID=UPI0035C87A9C
MNNRLKTAGHLALIVMATAPLASLSAQQAYEQTGEVLTTVEGELPTNLAELPDGPQVEGVIAARSGNRLLIKGEDGTRTEVSVGTPTTIKSSGGFLGLSKEELTASDLLNGLPVSVDTKEWGGGLLASRIDLKSKDLKVANMIHSGTEQGFAEQTAATEALRGRVGDIDKYNVKATTNVNFDTGKYNLSEQAKADLCQAANQAEATDNALLLVVGYTDSTGSYEVNQDLSEKRAARVVNYLQQQCGWAPYRMLTPTGMAEADPLADNYTDAGKAQNRRVAVNILVSKSVDGF